MNRFRLIGVGDTCVDYYLETKEMYPGGQPVNSAVYTARHGYRAAYVGLVGQDEFGHFMRKRLQQENVDTSHMRAEPGKTSVTYVKMDGTNRVLVDWDNGIRPTWHITEEEVAFAQTAEWVHTSIWALLEKELPRFREKGALVSYDFAGPDQWGPDGTDENGEPSGMDFAMEKIEAAMPYIDYAFFGGNEDDSEQTRDFVKKVFAKGKGTTKAVIYTLGADGSLAYDGKQFYQCGAVPVKVVDTMGAGDTYIAGFMNAIVEKNSIEDAMRQGALWASETIQYFGAW